MGRIGCLLMLCLVLCALTCDRGRPRVSRAEEIEGGQRNAAAVIDALEAYRRDHGEYPEKLQLLLTHYLRRLPKTPAGLGYTYWRSDLLGGYGLCFDLASSHRRSACCYAPDAGSWECSPKPPE